MADFTFLLVEDQPELREQLKESLSSIFKEDIASEATVAIDDFGDVRSAAERIKSLADDGKTYDVAVLDYQLPPHSDAAETVDLSLYNMLRKGDRTLIWQITAFSKNPEVGKHIQSGRPPDEQSRVMNKHSGLTGELIEQIRQVLPARHLKRQLLALAPSVANAAPGRTGRADAALPSSTTLMAKLCVDIGRFWRYLHPAFQSELEETFLVDQSSSPVLVRPK